MKFYLVGGIIRDRMLGVESNDYDYSVVLPPNIVKLGISPEKGFEIMKDHLEREGFKIYLSTPHMFTIRAKFPKTHKLSGQDADFVLARKEVGYNEGTREPILELGNLYDDLIRRDFTINAMAEDIDTPGIIVDYFGGKEDLENMLLRTPTEPSITMFDDPLRLLRAIRFSITKDMNIDDAIWDCINEDIINKLTTVVSQERIQDELNKMFKHDSSLTIKVLMEFDEVLNYKFFPILFKLGYYLQMVNKKIKK